MKKIFYFLKTYPIIIVFILMCIMYFPSALVMEPESAKKAFVTSMAIDKVDEQNIELSLAVVVPISSLTSTEKIRIVSARGNTINSCLSKISLHIGKEIELAHTNLVIINLEFGNENIAEKFNFLTTNFIISNGTEMIATNGSGKDLLNASLNMFNSIGVKIYQLLSLNTKYVDAIESTISSFYQGYLSDNGISFLNVVNLKEEDYEGVVASDDENNKNETKEEKNNNSGKEISSKDKKRVVSNNGETAIFKDGQYITTLKNDETKALNFLNSKTKKDFIEIKDINDENLKSGQMTFQNTYKKVKIKTYFENKKPIVKIKLNLALRIEEIYEKDDEIHALGNDVKYFTKEVNVKVKESIKENLNKLINKSKEYNIDLLSIYNYFNFFNNKEFNEYMKSLNSKDDFYDDIVYKVEINTVYVN